MTCQLPTDCLSEIFEYLEEDKSTLHSCLLVNRHWCKISVRILWRNIWKFNNFSVHHEDQLKIVTKAMISTLIACLPDESLALLYRNKIFIPIPTSKPPMFNYPGFCRVLSIHMINLMIDFILKNELTPDTSTTTISLSLKDKHCLIAKEIITMFMNQISSLRKVTCYPYYSFTLKDNISFTCFSETKDCLTDLSELYCCSSNIHSKFFYQLSQICHNLKSLTIRLKNEVPNELKELISLQNNLKNLNLFSYDGSDWNSIIPTLTKHSNTLRKLYIYSDNYSNNNVLPLSFISSFSNLQEIKLSFTEKINFEDFKTLQNVTFPKLKILKIPYQNPKTENLIKFLENNGKYLIELLADGQSESLDSSQNESLGLSIAKFCPNLKKLSVRFNDNELDTLKTIFNECQYLESIKVWCGEGYLSEKEVLEAVAKNSPENFCELKISNHSLPELFSDLELFFMNWKNRVNSKLLSLIILNEHNDLTEENTKAIIEKYKNLSIIKKFDIKEFSYEESEEKNRDYF